jgi:acetaldehyde dehydrogenase/alcohol dehydrogenase
MPQKLTAYGGIDTLVHALESYVSIFATDYTKGLSREAVSLTLRFLPRAYVDGAHDYEARERIHSAATIAGMAFANAFLGICHSMAHKLGARFHVPHGLANAALISHVIRYNASDRPMKQVGPAVESVSSRQGQGQRGSNFEVWAVECVVHGAQQCSRPACCHRHHSPR